jgi:hypothetical protein
MGPNRNPQSLQNPYLRASAFAYPAAFTPGTPQIVVWSAISVYSIRPLLLQGNAEQGQSRCIVVVLH